MHPDEIVIDVTKKSYKPVLIKVGLLLGVLVVLCIVPFYWPVSTRVSLEVPANRVEWTLGLFPSQQILNPLVVETLSFEKFASVDFTPSTLYVADPEQGAGEKEAYPRSAWHPVTVFGQVRLSPKSQDTLIRIQPANPVGQPIGILSAIHVREESNVILEISPNESRKLHIIIMGPESSVQFTPTEPFEMITGETNFAGIKEFPLIHKSSLTFRPDLPEHRSTIEIKGTKQQLMMMVTIASSQSQTLLSEQAIPIKAIDFSRKDHSGRPQSTLVGPAQLIYSDFSGFPAKPIPMTDLIQIEPSQILTIQRIAFFHENPALAVSLDGIAKSLQSGSNGVFSDHRISLADRIGKVLPSSVN